MKKLLLTWIAIVLSAFWLTQFVLAEGNALMDIGMYACKTIAIVNPDNTVTITTQVFDISNPLMPVLVPTPTWYTFVNTAQASGALSNYRASINPLNWGGLIPVLPNDLYSIKTVMITPAGDLINCQWTRFLIKPLTPAEFIDLSLTQELINNNQNIYKYKLTVTNDWNVNAVNFRVKSYIPSNMVFMYASNYGFLDSRTPLTPPSVNRMAISLNPGQSRSFTFELKKVSAWNAVSKSEVCSYEWMNSLLNPRDIDSNPCNMWASGSPSQDDETQLINN